ncbi:MAG: hypothetical protein ACJA0V_001689, partial [Planctomycetota bacterium]
MQAMRDPLIGAGLALRGNSALGVKVSAPRLNGHG